MSYRGINTVTIQMFYGVIRALGNLKYVPRPKRNLISMGTLNKSDYGYSTNARRLKVTKEIWVEKVSMATMLQISLQRIRSKRESR